MKKNKKKYWVGFDLGGTKMLATVYNNSFKPLASERKKTKANEGLSLGLMRIHDTICSALRTAKIDSNDLCGIGMGCPGPLDLDKGIILETPNLGWKNVKMKAFLEKQFKCHAIIANDVDAGVYGEYRFGAGCGARCTLGVFPGTGIGGGCVYEGKIIRGKTGSCMEFGHMQIIPDGPLCGCGKNGCLEAIASRLAIASAAAAAAYRGQAPYLLKEAGTDLNKIRSGTLAESIRLGDKAIEEIIIYAARSIGIGVANAINLLSPDVIILGGGAGRSNAQTFSF